MQAVEGRQLFAAVRFDLVLPDRIYANFKMLQIYISFVVWDPEGILVTRLNFNDCKNVHKRCYLRKETFYVSIPSVTEIKTVVNRTA